MSLEKGSTSSSADSPGEPRSYHESIGENQLDLVNTVSQSLSQDPRDNVLTRLSTLSKKLSHYTAQEMSKMLIDKDDFDLQKVLQYMNSQSAEQGFSEKHTGVEMEHVSVFGIDDSTSIVGTVADFLGAPILAPKRWIFGDKSAPAKKIGDDKYRKILSNVSANVNAGEMCLVLGRPGAGCSSFLRTVAGETEQFIRVDGDISYNNIPQKEMVAKFKRDIIYNPELDIHFPHLTVDQTLKFAIACRTPAVRVDGYSRQQYIETIRDLWATVFGLSHTFNTKVGNDFVRGVSGGERKRVSIAEAMVTQGSVYCWDNATRGLDASTALEYAEAIRTSTNLMKVTSFVTIYQAGENIYETFDKVTVLYQGRQIYFGPAMRAKQYFIDMGFECPPRQATAEFLTAITDPIGRFPRAGYENSVPRTAAEFEAYWLNSPEHTSLQQEIAQKRLTTSAEHTASAFSTNMKQQKMRGESAKSRYTVNFLEQLKLCTIRGMQNIIGDKAYSITNFVAAVIQALMIGSMYYNLPQSSSSLFGRGGVTFFSILYFSMMAMAEVPISFAERPILTKQKGYSFYHPSANVLSTTITQIPVKLFYIAIYVIIVYFLVDMKQEAGAFFSFLLFVNLTAQTISALFMMFSALAPTVAAANAMSGICMLLCIMYASYMLQRPSMVPWFKWLSYMNPVLYGYEALFSMELHGRRLSCDNLVPSGPGYENVSSLNQVCGATANNGQVYIDGDYYLSAAFNYSFSHQWRNLGIMLLFWVSFLALNCIFSEMIKITKSDSDRLSFIRGARFRNSIIGPDTSAPLRDDVESGPYEKRSIEFEVDNNRSTTEKHRHTALGSDEIFMWQNVDYTIPYKGETRKLLDNIQGYVKPGSLTALMGESGAGKTTLLNVLSQRIDMGIITGDMLVNGNPTDRSFERRTGYVQQQDVHIPELTVRESLQFSARLRRPGSVSEEEKLEYVETIIDILQMRDYADAVAGNPGTGLNVEQRKKLSIATELVAKPSLLLFLDEPTSGLDSQSAWAIVQIMRDLAHAGQAILCTIHQPSATLFEAFDRLLLLKKGGQTVYFGDIGENSRTILDYFESNGARECAASENPAEYILEAIGAGATASVEEDWSVIWTQSRQYAETTDEINALIRETSQRPAVETVEEHLRTYAMPYWYQFQQVFHRTWTQFYRDVDFAMTKFALFLVGGLLVGFSYWNVKHSVVGMQNAMFATFISFIISVPLANATQDKAMGSRQLYEVRESKSNTFHWSALLLCQLLVEIPYSIFFATLYFISWYFPVQLDNSPDRAGVWWLNYAVFFQVFYISMALWVVYMSPDLASANAILAFLTNFIISFSGVAQPPSAMPGFWTFMYKVSPYTYFIQTGVGVALHGREVTCREDEMSYLTPPEGLTCGEYLDDFLQSNYGYVENPNATDQCGYCQFSVADEYMETLGMKYSYRWRNVGFYFVFILFNVFAMLGCFYLFRVRKTKSKSKSKDKK